MTNPEDELLPDDGPTVPPPQKKNRPMVEGINAPKSAPNVASQIIPAVPDTKITLPSMVKKSHPVRNFLVWLVVLAGLGYGGFWAYGLYRDKAAESSQQQASPENVAITSNEAANETPSSTLVTVASSTPSVVSTTTSSTPAVEGAVLKQLKVNNTETGFLNVRSQPSTAGSLVGKIYPGETYPYTEVKFQWYHITMKDGTQGWVSGTYVTEQ